MQMYKRLIAPTIRFHNEFEAKWKPAFNFIETLSYFCRLSGTFLEAQQAVQLNTDQC